jgi:hypothetical protein
MELEPSTNFRVMPDRRRFVPPPPPVSLVTVEDARLPATTGLERALDQFYVNLLEFERDAALDGLVYKADNFRLHFDLFEGPANRDDMRMLGIIVKSLEDTQRKLREEQIEFAQERGLVAGEERLVLLDPAGNWIRITQSKPIM